MLYTIIGVHVSMLIFESDIPWFEVFVGIAAHVTYITLLPHFPFIDLTSPKAIFAGIMALINHFAWFYHMVNYAYYSYGEIIAIFVICVWACPLAFVISLSTTEQLPYGAEAEGAERRKGSNRIANLFRMLKRKQEELLPSSTPKTLWFSVFLFFCLK